MVRRTITGYKSLLFVEPTIFSLCICLLFIAFYAQGAEKEERKWSVTTYGALLSEAGLESTLFDLGKIDNSFKFTTLALARKIGSRGDSIDFEVEGQIAKHTEGQHHWEFNALIIARWLPFPWDNIIMNCEKVTIFLSL